MPQLDLAISTHKAKAGAAAFAGASNSVVANAGKMDLAIAGVDTKSKLLSSSMMVMAKAAAGLFVFSKVSKYIAGTVKEFSALEAQMAQVSTMLTEQTMHLLPGMTDAVRDMSVEFGEGTETLNKGLYDILSASIDASKALDVLEVSAMAAKGGITGTGTAADVLTTVLNSYGLEADKALWVSDILFATVAGGKTTFNELAQSVGQVAAVASIANLSFEEVGAALATMTRAGLQTTLAVTALKGVVNTFLSPTDDAIKVAAEFGLELNSTTLKTIGLVGVMEKLKDVRAEDVSSIFSNIRAFTGMATLLQQVDGYQNDLINTTNASGRTQTAYRKNTKTLIQTTAEYTQSTKDLAVELGESLSPMANLALKSLTALNIALKDTISGLGPDKLGASLALLEVKRLEGAARSMERYAKFYNSIGMFGTADGQTERARLLREEAKVYNDVTMELLGYKKAADGTWMDKEKQEAQRKFRESVAKLVPITEETTDKTKEFNDELERLKSLQEEVFVSDYDVVAAQSALDNERDSIDGLIDSIKELKLQQDLMGKTPEQQQVIRREVALETMVGGIGSDNPELNKLINQYRELSIELAEASAEERKLAEDKRDAVTSWDNTSKAIEREQKAKVKAIGQVADLSNELKVEKSLLGLVDDERERAIRLIRFEAAAKEAYGDGSDAVVEAYRKELEELGKLQELLPYAQRIGDGFAEAIETPFEALIDNTIDLGESLKKTMNNILKDIYMMMVRQQITQPLTTGLTQSFMQSARGNVFGNGNITAMGRGAIISEKTTIPMSMMGENGDEAVLPLGRDGHGDLGVKIAGSSGGSGSIVNVPPSVIINNNTGQEMQSSQPEFDGEQWVIDISVKNISERGDMFNAIAGMDK